MVRNGGNTLGRSLREMGYKVGDNLKSKIANNIRQSNPNISERALSRAVNKQVNKIQTEIRAIGANRVASYYAATLGVPQAMIATASSLTGVTDKQLKDTSWSRPPFMEGHNIMPISGVYKENGKEKLDYIDLTYMLPHDMLLVPFRLAFQKYNEKGSVSPNEAKDVISAMWQGFTNFMDPFLGESLIAERLLDVTYRGGATQTGAKIYFDGEAPGEVLTKSMLHILNGLNPTIVENLITLDKGQIRKGKISKAITGEGSKIGDEINAEDVALTQLSGLKKMTTDFQTALEFKALEYKSESKGNEAAFRQILNQNDSSYEDILNQYDITNNQRYQQQQRLYEIIEKARSIGIKDSTIMRSFRREDRSGLSLRDIQIIMKGKFSPLKITPNMARKILNETIIKGEKRVVTDLPYKELLEKFNKASFLSLEKTDLESARPKAENIILKPSISSFGQEKTVPTFDNTTLKPSISSFGNTTSKPSTKTRTDPAFLGSNPVDILKNLAIGNRTQ